MNDDLKRELAVRAGDRRRATDLAGAAPAVRCHLCGAELPVAELRQIYSHDYRGQTIVVTICRDDRGCVARAVRRA